MATVYVSYRSTERAHVEAVLSHLDARHELCVDYNMPNAVDWRSYQAADLRRSAVFLVFISADTHASALQNAEIGAARFCSTYQDGKVLLPVLFDPVEPPASIRDINYLDLTHRDPVRSARQIDEAIARTPPRVRLFISHAHRDQDIAARLVDVITSSLDVPDGELRCTSVDGYQLALGAMAPDVLRRELGSAGCVIAILTPISVAIDWVHFELGAAWAHARTTIPLLAGGLEDKDIPGPLRGAAGGQLAVQLTIDRLLEQLERELQWKPRSRPSRQKQYDLVEYMKNKTFPRDPLEEVMKASFAARRARIGNTQGRLLDYLSSKLGTRPHVPMEELTAHFKNVDTSIFYRLEQLRLLGFLDRVTIGEAGGLPVYGWLTSEAYRRELNP